MTNGWVDIKNADVILCMGGNPAENHPCGFKWAIEAKKTRNAKIVAVDPRFTRTAAVADVYSPIRAGTDIAYLAGPHPLHHREQEVPRGLRQDSHQRPVRDRREVRLHRRPVRRLERGDQGLRQGRLGLRGEPEEQGLRSGRDASEPALRLPAPEEARRALHARDGLEDLRRAEGDVPEGRRDRELHGHGRPRRHDHVRPRLDRAFDGRADHPLRRDAAAPARQRRAPGRRRQCPARPLQHPGRHGHGRQHGVAAGLPEDAGRGAAEPEGVPRDQHADDAQQDALAVHELLAELPEVHGFAL